MKYVLITGSSGLVGSEAVSFFHKKGFKVLGIDNNYRKFFFGKDGCTNSKKEYQINNFKNFISYNLDVRNYDLLKKIFSKYKSKIKCIIHAAAQPSHDWAINDPLTDFSVNALGTLNLLDLTKKYCSNSVFIFVSTNKVYGDNPNYLPFKQLNTRYEIRSEHKFSKGINENMSIDNNIHSLFGVSKASADLLVQEYGKNIGMKTGVFRLGCISGAAHSGVELHGFLNYLVKANIKKIKYKIFGYKGKQVRDNIHAHDLIKCFWEFFKNPKKGQVYNIGGGRKNSCSILEAISKIEKITNIKMKYKYIKKNRSGDHIWYISDNSKFKKDFKNWNIKFNLNQILKDIVKEYL